MFSRLRSFLVLSALIVSPAHVFAENVAQPSPVPGRAARTKQIDPKLRETAEAAAAARAAQEAADALSTRPNAVDPQLGNSAIDLEQDRAPDARGRLGGAAPGRRPWTRADDLAGASNGVGGLTDSHRKGAPDTAPVRVTKDSVAAAASGAAGRKWNTDTHIRDTGASGESYETDTGGIGTSYVKERGDGTIVIVENVNAGLTEEGEPVPHEYSYTEIPPGGSGWTETRHRTVVGRDGEVREEETRTTARAGATELKNPDHSEGGWTPPGQRAKSESLKDLVARKSKRALNDPENAAAAPTREGEAVFDKEDLVKQTDPNGDGESDAPKPIPGCFHSEC